LGKGRRDALPVTVLTSYINREREEETLTITILTLYTNREE